MIVRQALRSSLAKKLRACFSTPSPFFSKGSEPERIEPDTKGERVNAREALAALVGKINEANKYFLGVKLNTNYLKISKSLPYEEAAKLTSENKTTLSDLPLEIVLKPDQQQIFDSTIQQAALQQKSAKVAFSHGRFDAVIGRMQRILQGFILGLGNKHRLEGVEPNFHLQCIKTLNSLDAKLQIQLAEQEALPEVLIKSVTLLKGLSAYRNDNYSTDSFEKNETEVADGILTYKLYRQPKEQYPQAEWFSTKRINARFQVIFRGGPAISVLDSGNPVGSSAGFVHSAVFQADLVPPPPNSEHQISSEDFLKSYRLNTKALLLTNVDRRNTFYPLTYTETEKKTVLVNRII